LIFISNLAHRNGHKIHGLHNSVRNNGAVGGGRASPAKIILAANSLAEQHYDLSAQCIGDKGRGSWHGCRPGAFGKTTRWGLLNNLPIPGWGVLAGSIIILDLAIYLQHITFHAVPALWRVHRMHHADLDFDTTTGVRFHPIEILLSMLIKFSVVATLGASAPGVLIFEIVLNAASVFNHSNVRIPVALDHYLRWLVVTPDMHRVHHSILASETNSNFGFNLTWWDRLLGTYRDKPAAGHESVTVGIEQFRETRELWLDRMLLQPLRGPTGTYPITGRKAA
jgi:sterol desaturase/sphingolipid hydroxylase (fatty acid hydroxylase superfamily)